MRLQKDVLTPGDGINFPTAGDSIGVHYTGWLYRNGAPNGRGRKCVCHLGDAFQCTDELGPDSIALEDEVCSRLLSVCICSTCTTSSWLSPTRDRQGHQRYGSSRAHLQFISVQEQSGLISTQREGWDILIPQMSLGERSILQIPRYISPVGS